LSITAIAVRQFISLPDTLNVYSNYRGCFAESVLAGLLALSYFTVLNSSTVAIGATHQCVSID
jgi:hypothetical protein